MECPHCGSKDLKVFTTVGLEMPIEDLGKITKRKIRAKGVVIRQIADPKTFFACGRCKTLLNSLME